MDLLSKFETAGHALKRFFKGTEAEELCIQSCFQCYQACEQMIGYCLSQGWSHASPRHIGLLEDCSAICETTARFLMHRSDFRIQVCSLCEAVCRSCADDCERLGDDVMKAYAEVCRRCAESCRQVTSQH